MATLGRTGVLLLAAPSTTLYFPDTEVRCPLPFILVVVLLVFSWWSKKISSCTHIYRSRGNMSEGGAVNSKKVREGVFIWGNEYFFLCLFFFSSVDRVFE